MKTSSPTHSEKRDFIRMRVDTPASVIVKTIATNDSSDEEASSSNQAISGMCKDLSGGGILLELKTSLELGMIVEVDISSSYGHKPMLKAKAEVSRVDIAGGADMECCDVENIDANMSNAGSISEEETQPTYLVGLTITELLLDD